MNRKTFAYACSLYDAKESEVGAVSPVSNHNVANTWSVYQYNPQCTQDFTQLTRPGTKKTNACGPESF